jgi:hypothetical protein
MTASLFCRDNHNVMIEASVKMRPAQASILALCNFRSSCSNADAMRSTSHLLSPCRPASSRHLETTFPTSAAILRDFLDRIAYTERHNNACSYRHRRAVFISFGAHRICVQGLLQPIH